MSNILPRFGFQPHEQAEYRAKLKQYAIHTRDTTAIVGYLMGVVEGLEKRVRELECGTVTSMPVAQESEAQPDQEPDPDMPPPDLPWVKMSHAQRNAVRRAQGKKPMPPPFQGRKSQPEV